MPKVTKTKEQKPQAKKKTPSTRSRSRSKSLNQSAGKSNSRGKRAGKQPPDLQQMATANPDAAGADIGAREIYVCVPEHADPEQPVRRFETFTADLHKLADWLVECKIRTLAMESTGLYWLPLYQILEDRGIEVCLVNARHVKHVPGRKSDVKDCQWLQFLHSVGLLRGSFRPAQEICAVRSLNRHRQSLLEQAADQVRHMHKALDQMNLQIHHVLSDLTGATGLAIVEAIVAGERDPAKLAGLRRTQVKSPEQTLRKSLEGDWRPEHLLVLRLAWQSWQHIQSQLEELDRHLQQAVEAMEGRLEAQEAQDLCHQSRCRMGANAPKAAKTLREEYCRILGVDLTTIPAISVITVQAFLTEIGPDLSRFPSVKHFISWLGLCPGTKISGGKVLDARSRKGKPRFALLLRQAAQSLHRSQSALGACYRRLRARLGAPQALTAMAHKLARIIYTLITRQCSYDESLFADTEKLHAHRQFQRLQRQAQKLGYSLVNQTPPPTPQPT